MQDLLNEMLLLPLAFPAEEKGGSCGEGLGCKSEIKLSILVFSAGW